MKRFKALLDDRNKWSDIYELFSEGYDSAGDAPSVFDAGTYGVMPRGLESRGKFRDSRCGASLEALPGEGTVDMLRRLSTALPSAHPLLVVLPDISAVISSRIIDVLLSPVGNTVVSKSASLTLLEPGAVVDAYPEMTPYNSALVVVHGSVACLAFSFDDIHSNGHIQSSNESTCFFSPNEFADSLRSRGFRPSVSVIEKGGMMHLHAGTYYSLVSLDKSGISLLPIPGSETALIFSA
jgi:hypothetical protein